MTVARILYPFALASFNIVGGWVLFSTVGSVLGVALLLAGVLVSAVAVLRLVTTVFGGIGRLLRVVGNSA
ncbi:MAG: hypothetical protein ABEJ08_02520 [Halobacteriaceae archaeon]